MSNFLGLVDKWNSSIYGCSSNETSYLNYLSSKYYLIWTLQQPSDLWNEYKNFPHNLMMEPIWNNDQPVTLHFSVCRKTYMYKGRMWVIINHSFNNFIKKVKNYYKNKIDFYKKPKNLRYKQTHGKYPRFTPNYIVS
jgi:hypothetical protein